jgi:uncharacterized protein YlxP (DUF503 family)
VAFLLAVTIHLHLPDNGSLKGKRKELLAVRSALTRRFGASVAEVDHQDLWQRSTLAAALVGGSAGELQNVGAKLQRYLEARYPEGVRIEQQLMSFEDFS